jgi:hypothetical protein
MGRNFEGLGLGFEVDDDDGSKKIAGISDSVEDLWGDLKKAGDIVGRAGGKIGKGLRGLGRIGTRGIGGVTLALGQMVDKAMSPELDTAYSSMYASFNKTFSAATSGMNMTTEAAKKMQKAVGGVAFGMGEDMDQATKSMLAFEKQSIDLEKVLGTDGLTSTVKSLIKVTSVFGIEGEQLAQVTASLVKGFGFTEERVGSLADKIFVLGKQFNIGRETLQAWPSVMDSVNRAAADFGRTLNPEEIENLTVSIYQLGVGMKESLGLTGPAAMELSRGLFDTFASERKNILQMARGMGSEFGDITKMLFETGGDVQGVFGSLLEGDPLRFMDFLREMAKNAERQGGEMGIAFQRLTGVMADTLGPDVTFAMKGNWDKVRGSLEQIPALLSSPETQGALKNAADAHWKSSITAGEAWDRMINGMKAQLFALSNKEIGGWKKQMQKGFKDTFSVIKDMAADKGILGQMTTKLLAVQRVGLSALIPGMASLSPLLGGIASSAMPAMTALGSMGLTFGSLGKMAMSGGALWGLFQLLKYGPEEAWQKVKDFATNFWDSLGKVPKLKKIRDRVASIFEDFKSGKILKDIQKMVADVDWEKVIQTAVTAIGMAAKATGGIVFALLGGTDESSATKEATASMGSVLTNVFKGLKTVLIGSLKGLWGAILDPKSLQSTIGNLVKVFAGGFMAILVLSKGFRKKMMGNMGGMFKGMRKISAKTMAATAMIVMGVVEATQQIQQRMGNINKIMSDPFIKDAEKAALAGEQAFMGIMHTLDSVFMGLPGMLGEALGVSEDDLSKFYHWMVAGFETVIFTVVEAFSNGWQWISSAAEGVVSEILGFFKDMQLGIKDLLYTLGEKLEIFFQTLGSKIYYPFALLGHKLKGWIADFVEGIFGTEKKPTIVGTIVQTADKDIFTGVMKVAKDLKEAQRRELAGERDFATAYEIREKKELEETQKKWDKKNAQLENERMVHEQTRQAFQEEAYRRQTEAAAGLGSLADNAKKFYSDAEKRSIGAAKTSERLRAEQEGKVVDIRKEKEKREERKGRKKVGEAIPTPEERGKAGATALEQQSARLERMIGEMTGTVKENTEAVKKSTKSPIDIYLQSDIPQTVKRIDRERRKKARGGVARGAGGM